jgi:hypothetical protein
MTVYPSFASTASLPSALDESANHVDAGEDFEAVSRSIVMNRSKIQLAGTKPCHFRETRLVDLRGPSSGTL